MMIFAAAKSDLRKDAISYFAKLRICQAMRTVKQRQLDILPRRCAWQEIKTLKDETDFAIANISEPIAIKARNIGTIQKVMTRSRSIETTEKIHQRGFPGTARTHQRYEFGTPDIKRDAAHGVHFHFSSAICFVNIDQPDDFAVLSCRFFRSGCFHPKIKIVAVRYRRDLREAMAQPLSRSAPRSQRDRLLSGHRALRS